MNCGVGIVGVAGLESGIESFGVFVARVNSNMIGLYQDLRMIRVPHLSSMAGFSGQQARDEDRKSQLAMLLTDQGSPWPGRPPRRRQNVPYHGCLDASNALYATRFGCTEWKLADTCHPSGDLFCLHVG